uniref:Phage protein n=1 Tax=Rhabditophanes sp. KR3021 TaxID=114890 RepID=A0AC35U5J0_9BILA
MKSVKYDFLNDSGATYIVTTILEADLESTEPNETLIIGQFKNKELCLNVNHGTDFDYLTCLDEEEKQDW